MKENNLPSNPAQVTKELVKADFNIELTRLNYQQVVQSVASIQWTRENIDQDLLAPGNIVAKKLTEKKDALKRPHIDAGKVIQNEYNGVFNPLNEILSVKANERKQLALQIQKEVDDANREIDRVNGIKQTMAAFISNITNEITNSDNEKMIAAAEMRIGSEVARKNIYQELLPELKEQCEGLKPLIKNQKEYIKTLKQLEKSQGAAMAKGDDDAAVELREKAEQMKETIEENKIRLQEKAFEAVENSDTVVGVPTAVAPKATRTWWTWEVPDPELAYKKNQDNIDLVPNKTKIDAMLAELKENGSTEGKREVVIDGIRFYEEKSFK